MNKKKLLTLTLLRGLPGSGKSTLAKLLSENGKYPVHSIDSYFTSENGEYNFEFDKNYLAYKNCEEQTRKSLESKCEKVFVDNTFTLGWEMEPYFKMSSELDYTLFVVTVENYHGKKNIHNISKEQIEKMAEKFKVKLA